MIIFVFLSILLSSSELSTISSAQNTLRYDVRCTGSGNYTPNSIYQFGLYYLLGNLTSQASQSSFYKSSYGKTPDQVFVLYLCRGDTNSQDCSECINEAKDTIIKDCPYQTGALIWYPKCMVRFSNESFLGTMDVTPRGLLHQPRNVSRNETRFEQVVRDTVSQLATRAASGEEYVGKKFAAKEVNVSGFSFRRLYALTQCTPDLTTSVCKECLMIAIDQLNALLGSVGARVVQPSCCVRYEIYPFFNRTAVAVLPSATSNLTDNSQDRLTGRRHHSTQHALVGIPISIAIVLGVVGVLIYLRKKKAAQSAYAEINEIKTVESLQFDLSTIKAATNNFSPENGLGEGGFGEVYKGILENGQEVAIKRLSKNSGQGIEAFKTEVDLVAKLQHKNLVKLLGYCLSSTEKILVYEFLRNSSLDRFLFDRTKKESLDWETRFKLIIGVARGLLYLHEDSRLKVIHRDLKPSNILLDESMNPKISDFGLAKLFGVDQTQDDTKRIVGTYGYMAPEYAMTGHFSVKSDVYSFGIIMLEIISGQKNKFFGRHPIEEALLHRAWRLWNEGKSLNLVDTALANKYPEENVERCIHIALMCIQENATERPRMATVIGALNERSISLPMPKAPNFFGNTNTTNKETSSSHSDALIGDDRQEWEQNFYPFVYTGSEEITELHPR